VRGQGTLSNKFPVVGKNHQDPDGGIDNLSASDKLAVKDPQDAAAAYNPRPFRKGVGCLAHPPEQRTPWLLLYGEEEEHVAYVYAFVRRAVVLRQQET
jgi:hypothetical protein